MGEGGRGKEEKKGEKGSEGERETVEKIDVMHGGRRLHVLYPSY